MGRGVEPNSIPRRLQHSGSHSRGGPLAIRAGNVQCSVPGLRHAESHHQRSDRHKTQFDAMLLQTIQIGHGRGIGHGVIREEGG